MEVRQRIMSRVELRDLGYISECWVVSGQPNEAGYAVINIDRKPRRCHRVMYQAVYGELPANLDHRCHSTTDCTAGRECLHRRCCNPEHLAPSTHAENSGHARTPQRLIVASGQCGAGLHPWEPENTRWYRDNKGRSHRKCRACDRRRDATRVRVR